MENKIDIAAILKDCPQGMELDCTMYDNLYFDSLNADYYGTINCYTLIDGIKTSINFTKYGTFNNHIGAKCVIFPKGKTTWEGFHRLFKDGDIIVTTLNNIAIIKKPIIEGELFCVYGVMVDNSFCKDEAIQVIVKRLATEEEKQKLLDTIKADGYKWNVETKTLEKLIEPKFKVGDRIKNSDNCRSSIVVGIKDDCFIIKTLDGFQHSYLTDKLPFSKQDEWELVTDKFNINTLKPFDRVLVRGNVGQRWTIDFFGFMDNNKGYPFVCVGHYVAQCIPFEGNEHLPGKTDDCDEYYKTWQ